jgi:hypothetical protein
MGTFWENDVMNENLTIPNLLDDPATLAADRQAVHDFAFKGIPLDPVIRDRVRARSARAPERAYQRHGYINIEELRRPSTYDDE